MTQARLWPLVALGLAQALLIAWLTGDVVADHRGSGLPVTTAGHGHGGVLAGPAPIAGEQWPHYAGLAAFTAHAVLCTLPLALKGTHLLVAKRGDDLISRLAFAVTVGIAGMLASVATSWMALRASTGATETLAEVTAVSAVAAFRYSFLLALAIALLGGAKWTVTATK